MSVKINKKNLKEYGGAVPPNYGPAGFFQQGGSMIPAQPAMMDEAAAVQQQQQAMAQQMDQPVEVQDEGRQMVQQLLQAIQAAVEGGSDIVEVIKVVIEQSGDEEVVKAALMMGGMEEQAVLEVIDKAKQPPEPSTPQEVDANPQLLARNEELAKEEEKMPEQEGASPEQIMMGKSGIEIKPENKGKFTAWAKKRGMTVKEAYRKVLANKSRYPASVVKMANFARNAAGWKKEEGGEYINGVYIPDESELSENALKNNLQRPASFYMADQNYSVEPFAPPSTVNPLFDFLNTAATVNQELFSTELDDFGNRKGAFLDIGKRGEGISINNPFKKGKKIQITKGNPDPDGGPSKMDVFNMTKGLYYDTEIDTSNLTTEENLKAYTDWARKQKQEWDESLQGQLEKEQEIIDQTEGTTQEERAQKEAASSMSFENWAQSEGYDLENLADMTVETLRGLWSKTIQKDCSDGKCFEEGGELPMMQFGQQPGPGMGGPEFNPYTDDMEEYLRGMAQTNYMDFPSVPGSGAPVEELPPIEITQEPDPTADELFQEIEFEPEVNVTNKVSGFLERVGDDPRFRAFTSGSKAAVDIAGFANRMFDRRKFAEAQDQLEERSGADYKFAVRTADPFDEGFYDINTGQLQGEAERTPGYYMSFAGSPYSFDGVARDGMETGEAAYLANRDRVIKREMAKAQSGVETKPGLFTDDEQFKNFRDFDYSNMSDEQIMYIQQFLDRERESNAPTNKQFYTDSTNINRPVTDGVMGKQTFTFPPKGQTGKEILLSGLPTNFVDTLPRKLFNVSGDTAEELVDIYKEAKGISSFGEGFQFFKDFNRKDIKRYMEDSGLSKRDVREWVYDQDWYKDRNPLTRQGIRMAMSMKGLKRGGQVVDIDQDMIAKLIAAGANIEML